MKKIIIACLVLTGCATQAPPSAVVDLKGVDMNQYSIDYKECQFYSFQVDVGGQAGNAALTAGLIGGVLGAMAGNKSTAAWTGGLSAAAAGGEVAKSAMDRRKEILQNCLRGRGYNVLG